jgi:hypothetical protein
MSKRSVLNLAGLIAGFGCAALLLWLWRQDPAHAPTVGHSTPTAAPALAAAAPAPSAAPRESLSPLDAALVALLRAIRRGDARPNEVLFAFKDDESLRRFVSRVAGAGLAITGQIPALRAVRVRFDDPETLRNALQSSGDDPAALGANPLVSLPHPPAREDRAALDQVPFGNDTLAFLGANGDRTSWGRGATIAILDTGVAGDVTFGQGRIHTLDIGLGTAPGLGEEDGHGTAVAALAAGAAPDAPGVAPGANLLSIRVTDASATSDLFTLSQAIVAAVDSGAKLINISLGGYATGAVLDAAIGYATQNGALIVAAAGNDQAAQLAWPAADPRVISVGAVDKAEQQVSFSNSGPQLQLSAPGYGVQTAWLDGQRVTVDGTSASAPLVAGAIAAILSQNPGLSPQQAVDLLVSTANDSGQPGADPAFGHGIVNLATALNRNNPAYVDTAVSSQYFDPANNEMQFVVQNRSGRTVSGLALSVDTAGATSLHPVPSLAAGETYVVKVPVTIRDSALTAADRLRYTSTLTNPPGTVDAVPANNQRSSVLTAPPKP